MIYPNSVSLPVQDIEGSLGLDDFRLETKFLQRDTTIFHFYMLFGLFVYNTCCLKEKETRNVFLKIFNSTDFFLFFLFNHFTVHLMSLWDKCSFLRLRRIIPPGQITYSCLSYKLHMLLIILFYFLVIGKNNVPVIFSLMSS